MQYVSVKKIGIAENALHPDADYGNSLEEHIGLFIDFPREEERFLVQGINYREQGIITSEVKRVINNNTFETLNSIYHWEFIEK